MSRLLLAALLCSSTIASAGSDSRECETIDKTIVMSAGTTANRVTFKVTEKGKSSTIDAPVTIKPSYDFGDKTDASLLIAIPVSAEKVISKKHQTMHVTHADGSQCDGRESWDDQTVLTYVLVGKDGDGLAAMFSGKSLKWLTKDNYVVAEMRCHTFGVSTAGGCRIESDKDVGEWRPSKF